MKSITKYFLILIAVSSLTALPIISFAQQPSIIDQMIRIKPSLVEVTALRTGWVGKSAGHARAGMFENRGAGVIIDPSGIIVTNAHVVTKANRIKILLADGSTHFAKLLRFAGELDLAFLKIEIATPLPAVGLTDSAMMKLNDEIFTVGNSPLLKESITGGRIIGLASSHNAKYTNLYESDFFETSFDLYSGDSGGPLFNRQGKLVGLITAKLLSKGHSSFAISANKIARYLAACRKDLGIAS